jgi:hypothetical protein
LVSVNFKVRVNYFVAGCDLDALRVVAICGANASHRQELTGYHFLVDGKNFNFLSD